MQVELLNEYFKVNVTTETTPPLDGYPVLYQRDDLELDDFYSARLFRIRPAKGQPYQFALLDLMLSFADRCAVLENNILTVLLFRKILQINLDTQELIRCVDCENMGGLEEICAIGDGYIIKGEGEIFRYDKELNPIWWRCGRDIFARASGENCFWLENDMIRCRDWEGWYYELDLDGKILRELREAPSGNE